MSASDTVAPEQTGFELERFQWSGPERLEVEGRWFGVRGRRFVRPVLTVQVGGRRRRLLALLEHKPWQADETESWIAAFPWEGSKDDVGEAELEVGALTVDLPPPGGSKRHRSKPASAGEPPARVEPAPPAGAEAGDRRPAAAETRHQLERDLAGARAELGRLRQRHEEESRELRAAASHATEQLEALSARAASATERAEQATGEATSLREELQRERDGQGAELDRLRASEAEARADAGRRGDEVAAAAAEAERQREAAGATSEELERLRAAAAEAEQLREATRRASAEADQLREAHQETLAENQRLRQAGRRASAEAERLRAASRRPGGPRPISARSAEAPDAGAASPTGPEARRPEPSAMPADAPATDAEAPSSVTRRSPDPQATVPFQVLADEPGNREAAAVPPPTVRKTTEIRGRPVPRPEPGAGAARLLGELPQRRLGSRTALEVWGPRLAALVLVALLLLALALIVRGIL